MMRSRPTGSWLFLGGVLCLLPAGCGEWSAEHTSSDPLAYSEDNGPLRTSSLPSLSIGSSKTDAPVPPPGALPEVWVPPAPEAMYPTTPLPQGVVAAPQFVVALDKYTGNVRWKRPRLGKHSYSTPLLIQVEGQDQLISVSGGGVAAYNPRTGEELWWMRHEGHSVVPRPVFSHGMVFICTGYHNPKLWAVDPTGIDDVSETHIVWEATRGTPLVASPLVVGDEIYVVTDTGIATCLDAEMGMIRWQHRLGGKFYASPWLADGRIHFLNEDGVCTIIEPNPEFTKIAENRLDGRTVATPAAVGGSLYVRSDRHLYCIEDPAAPVASSDVTAADAPQFRGVDGQGHASAAGQPLAWSETQNIAWKVDVPGEGWSSPVVAGDQIWLTTSLDDGRSLRALCYDRRTGRLVHNIEIFQKTHPGHVHLRNTHASATPVISAGCVYVHFGAHGTAAVSVDGEVLWRTQIPYHHHHGPASSPVVVDDLLIINCDGHNEPYDFELIQKMGPDYTGMPGEESEPQTNTN